MLIYFCCLVVSEPRIDPRTVYRQEMVGTGATPSASPGTLWSQKRSQ